MALTANAITLVVEGRAEDNGDVRLEDFVDQLQRLFDLLTAKDKAVNGRETVYYRIIDLQHQSPSTVVLEPVLLDTEPKGTPNPGGKVAQSIIDDINGMAAGKPIPASYGNPVLEAYRAFSSTVGTRVASVRLLAEGHGEASLSQEVTDRTTEIVTRRKTEIGSVTGFIERVNIHGKNRTFYVFPNYGAKSVRCIFPSRLRNDLINAVGRYATVHGTLVYQGRERHAELMVDVTKIEVHPLQADLPDILAMRGTMPGIRREIPFGR